MNTMMKTFTFPVKIFALLLGITLFQAPVAAADVPVELLKAMLEAALRSKNPAAVCAAGGEVLGTYAVTMQGGLPCNTLLLGTRGFPCVKEEEIKYPLLAYLALDVGQSENKGIIRLAEDNPIKVASGDAEMPPNLRAVANAVETHHPAISLSPDGKRVRVDFSSSDLTSLFGMVARNLNMAQDCMSIRHVWRTKGRSEEIGKALDRILGQGGNAGARRMFMKFHDDLTNGVEKEICWESDTTSRDRIGAEFVLTHMTMRPYNFGSERLRDHGFYGSPVLGPERLDFTTTSIKDGAGKFFAVIACYLMIERTLGLAARADAPLYSTLLTELLARALDVRLTPRSSASSTTASPPGTPPQGPVATVGGADRK